MLPRFFEGSTTYIAQDPCSAPQAIWDVGLKRANSALLDAAIQMSSKKIDLLAIQQDSAVHKLRGLLKNDTAQFDRVHRILTVLVNKHSDMANSLRYKICRSLF